MVTSSWMILALAVLVGVVVLLDVREHRMEQRQE